MTVIPMTGSPFWSVTVPLTVCCWAKAVKPVSSSTKVRIFLIRLNLVLLINKMWFYGPETDKTVITNLTISAMTTLPYREKSGLPRLFLKYQITEHQQCTSTTQAAIKWTLPRPQIETSRHYTGFTGERMRAGAWQGQRMCTRRRQYGTCDCGRRDDVSRQFPRLASSLRQGRWKAHTGDREG